MYELSCSKSLKMEILHNLDLLMKKYYGLILGQWWWWSSDRLLLRLSEFESRESYQFSQYNLCLKIKKNRPGSDHFKKTMVAYSFSGMASSASRKKSPNV